MNKYSLVLVSIAFSAPVVAADFVDTARVVSSTPIYERVSEPRQECWTENVTVQSQERSMGGSVVGGVAGGLLGSQVGGGSGKTAATAAGAIAGTMVGDRVSNPDSSTNRSPTGAIVGGVAGGLLGSQVGGGSGRNAAAAAGAIAGAIIGDRMANPETPQTQQVQRCRQVENYREEVSGYNVVYRYNGREVTTRLPYKPGATIRVGVSLDVLDNTRDSESGDSSRQRGDYRRDGRRGDRYRDNED